MFEWNIELVGKEKDIELLESFLINSNYPITRWKKRKLLTLPGVSPEADSETVHAASNRLIDVINGAMKLYYKRFGGVSFIHVTRFNDNGKRIGFGYLKAPDIGFTLTALNPEDRTFIDWVENALDDIEIERALYLYGSLEANWKNLYLVLEVIEESFGGKKKLLKANLVSEDDIKLFKRTANCFNAIGREARHGKIVYVAPPVPMKLDKAQDLIRLLLREWIKFKNRKE